MTFQIENEFKMQMCRANEFPIDQVLKTSAFAITDKIVII